MHNLNIVISCDNKEQQAETWGWINCILNLSHFDKDSLKKFSTSTFDITTNFIFGQLQPTEMSFEKNYFDERQQK